MAVRKKRKGYFFSIFVLTALSLILFTFKLKQGMHVEERADIFKKRIERTNMFVKDIEKDIKNAVHTLSIRAFWAAEDFIMDQNQYLDDAPKRLEELITNGTIDGEEVESMQSVVNWTDTVQKAAERLSINVSFENISLQVNQQDAWTINVTMFAEVYVIDLDSSVGWNFAVRETSLIDITKSNFTDPMYYLQSVRNSPPGHSPFTNTIRKTPYTAFWMNETALEGSFPDNIIVMNLTDHIKNQYYRKNPLAPSFLMRLEGEFGPSEFGIESFVNVLNEDDNANQIFLRSVDKLGSCAIDYQFFNTSCQELYQVQNLCYKPEPQRRFMINTTYMKFYNLTKINVTDDTLNDCK